MIIPKTKKNNIGIIFALLSVVGIGVLYLNANHRASILGWNPFVNSQEKDTQKIESAQQEQGRAIKSNSVDPETGDGRLSGSDQPPAPTPAKSGKSVVGAAITSANQNQSILQVKTLINILSSDGSCTLTLQKSGKASVTKTAKTQALSNTSTCQGFEIPVSELSPGEWTLQLQFDSSSYTGSASGGAVIQ